MVSAKRMIGCAIAAVLALALTLPPAYAAAPSTPDAREKPRPPGGPNLQQPRNTREAKRPYAKRNEAGEAPPPRMSPEERKQLRRDVKDAGREIYPPAANQQKTRKP